MSTVTPQITPLPPLEVVDAVSGENDAQPTAEAVDDTVQLEQDHDTDHDSAFGSDGTSTTGSVSSSIRHYREMHGRTYHNYNDTEYWGPNDDAANEQLDM